MKELALLLERILEDGFERVFGIYLSSYMGYVASTEDPDGYGRIKIILPFLNKTKPIEKWAWQKGRYAGKNYGSWNIPEVGEMVWVEFERGNLSYPIWSYGYHGKNELEPEWANVKDKWFRTPEGFHVRWKAEDKTFEISIPEGASLSINKDISLITDSKIFLGGLGAAAEPALLGDKTETCLNSIKDTLSDIRGLLTEVSTSDSAIATNFGLQYGVKFGIASAELAIRIQTLEQQIGQIKSQKVKLD
jgi:hypothetical protein